ncbi:CdaR family protein [Peptostreptococcus faecalis]|uniref:CdaR family protein n=1 Tax=Peptostreptococcus faecalis TaxID=2045015 RepID=UPI000C7BD579|nr:hypothetical protein [Peptostreptococcus faecalis]
MKKDNINNTQNVKTKVISLITALALWLYVMAVVDPSEKKVIENIPVNITNANEIVREGFVLYPSENLKTDITVQGKLSEVQKLNKNNVRIDAELINPVEGKNIVELKTNISSGVTRELKDSSLAVNLEKYITKTVNVKVETIGSKKSKISSLKQEKSEVEISGARSLVNSVAYVGGTIQVDEVPEQGELKGEVMLSAYSKSGKPVKVTVKDSKINVDIEFLMEKTVPVKLDYDGRSYNEDSYIIKPENLVIIGDNETLKKIEKIDTKTINDDDLKNLGQKKIEIVVPKHIKIKGDITEIVLEKK